MLRSAFNTPTVLCTFEKAGKKHTDGGAASPAFADSVCDPGVDTTTVADAIAFILSKKNTMNNSPFVTILPSGPRVPSENNSLLNAVFNNILNAVHVDVKYSVLTCNECGCVDTATIFDAGYTSLPDIS